MGVNSVKWGIRVALAILLLQLIASASLAGGLYINEIMASNVLAYASPAGEYEDWIEIYNAGSTPVDLAGYYFTDDLQSGDSWQIPPMHPAQTIIPAGAFRLFYADGRPELGADHLALKLDKDGEQIVLLGPDGTTIIDSLSYPSQLRDISYGRYPDGTAVWVYSPDFSPGAANSAGYASFSLPPLINQESGFYPGARDFTLQAAQAGDRIYYTLDGVDPGESSARYTGPVPVDRTAILKARTLNPGALPSEITSRVCFVGAEHSLPVLALMTDPGNLYDPATGIYVNDFDGRAWERPAEIAYLKDKELQFQYACGIRIQGNTGPKDYDKKSFRAYFRSGYGSASLNYPLFPRDSVQSCTRLVLRSGYDDSMEPSSDGKNAYATLLRDPLVTELWRRTGGLTSQSSFAVLYLNEGFHGIYDLRQSIDENFVMDHMGYADIDLMRTRWDSTELVYGSRDEWKKLVGFFQGTSFSGDEALAAAGLFLDLDNYITLQALVHATEYNGWGYGVFMFRNKAPGAAWQWTIWDADRACSDLAWNGFTSQYGPQSTELDNLITKKLLQNSVFRERYIIRICDLLNTVFEPARVTAIIDSLARTIALEIPAEVEKWDNTVAAWEENVGRLQEFAAKRPDIVRQQMQAYFNLADPARLTVAIGAGAGRIRVNSVTADHLPWHGSYFRDISVTLTAVPEAGFRFDGWSDPALPSLSTITLSLRGDSSLTAYFAPIAAVNAEVIVPARVRSGQHLPLVVRVRDENWAIDPVDQTPIQAAFGGARGDTVIQIKRGAGTAALQIEGDADFVLSVRNAHLPTIQRQIRISTTPIKLYSGTLPAGDVIWDDSADRLVTGDLTLPAGCRLIIKEGTWVLVQKRVNFYVRGEVIVEGTAQEPVVITSDKWNEPWGGMEFTGAKADFAWCFVLNGGGDPAKGYPTDDGWHTGHQHIFFGKEDSEFTFDHCFFLYAPGKVFGAQECKVTVTNSVSAFVWLGGEFHHSLLFYQDSHLLNLPNDDHLYVEDIDTDGFHIDYFHPRYPQYSVIDRCYFVTGKDDAIDHHAARLRISNCWLEDFSHEGVAASGGDTVRIFNSVALNNDQGFEAGWTDSGVTKGPFVFIDHCVAVGNHAGLRIGDSYTWTYKDFMKVTNTVLYNNDDNIWNYLLSTRAPLAGALDISWSMTNDPDYDASPGCITGIPQFDDRFYLLPSSPGSGAGTGGSNLGRADSTLLATGSVVINEIMHKTPATQDAKDWIELYNPQALPQDISGWRLTDDNGSHLFRIPEGTIIPARGFWVLCGDTSAFRQIHPEVEQYSGNISFGFGSADQVRLYTSRGARVDSVAYASTPPWPDKTDGEGYSLELIDPAEDHAIARNWARSLAYGGSPGRPNRTTAVNPAQETLLPKHLVLRQNYPNPFNAATRIEFTIPGAGNAEIVLYNLRGQRAGEIIRRSFTQAGTFKAAFNAGDLASGIYICRLEFTGEDGSRQNLSRKMVLIR
jgi:hypothetical protein